MPFSRAICLLCRSSVAVARAPSRIPQWQRRGPRFGSNVAGTRFAQPRSPTTTPNDEGDPVEHREQNSKAGLSSTWEDVPLDAGPPRPARRKPKARGIVALEMFENVVNKQDREDPEPTPAHHAQANLQLYEDLATLENMRSHGEASTAACFDFFYQRIYPLVKPPGRIPTAFRGHVAGIMAEVENAMMTQRGYGGDLPTVTEVTKIRRELLLLRRPLSWSSLILGLVDHICEAASPPNGDPAVDRANRLIPNHDSLVGDLVGAWRMFCLPDSVIASQGRLEVADGDFRLPPLDRNMIRRCASRGDSTLAIASLFPRYAPRQLHDLPSAVIATFCLLTDPTKASPAARQTAQGFVDAVDQILSAVPIRSGLLPAWFSKHPNLRAYALERWQEIAPTVEGKPAVRSLRAGSGRVEPHADPSAGKSRPRNFHKMLGQALRARDLGTCEHVWREFWGPNETPDAKKSQELRRDHEMFNYFIMAFAAMRQRDSATMVWASMAKVQLRPSLKTWTSYMEGCKLANNASGIRDAWVQLVQTGLKLDTAVWTARISGLIQGGKPEAGLAALDEMRVLWERSKEDKTPSPLAVQPSIEPVNAAIAGLLRTPGGLNAARNVLAWAARHAIDPDVITFNTLLQPLIREGLDDQVFDLLSMMKKHKVQANEATFTILMETMLPNLGDKPVELQIQTVNRILGEIDALGIRANPQTYGKLVYLLLQEGDRSREAVEAVLGFLWKRGMEPSSHIYTMLVEHYFTREPPDVDAVDQLIRSRGLDEKPGLDRVFWERVVKGYARAGDTQRALEYFEKIVNSLSVTSSTLESLLQALIDGRKLEEAAVLVQRVRSHRLLTQGEPGDSQARFWKHHFWHLASAHGLLGPAAEENGQAARAP